ncbi:hypothetical protein [Spiroplasma endosymbiont of Aspidapion aeneum]|uniref:hypothetical protein n=1 Tax=Spiroplasma endosymbiont of Aspidapion aeneum TaxID=3066276 RepID=UPI00313BE9AB
MKKHYDKTQKKLAIERFKNGESAKLIAKELNLNSGTQLVYMWAKKRNFVILMVLIGTRSANLWIKK